MAPEAAPRRNDFTQRFEEKYNEWRNNGIARNQGGVGTKEEARVETESTLAVPDKEIFGFENEVKSMKNFLLDQKVYNEFRSLVIVGEYGVGKTTLCQMIFNDEDVKSVYAPRIWVSMHSNESKEGLDGKICVLKKILKGLGVEDKILETIKTDAIDEYKSKQESGENDRETKEEKELAALLYVLHLNLRWKKYLIVFDDVREEDNWNEMLQDDEEKLKEDKKWGKYLSDGFPKGSGGRVIYTTRDENKNLAKKLVAEEHEIHRLWPLSDSKSVWDIYEAVVLKKGKEVPRNDKKCIDELMNKSRGLPLAARLIAELDPVLLDDETVANGSTHGPTDPASIQPPNSSGQADRTSS